MADAQTYTSKERNLYLTGMFGQNMIYNIVATGLYYYFQNIICLPAMALGWIFAIARVWDAVNDPMMGSIVDRTRTKWGKCRPYLIFCPIAICAITCVAFLNGNYAVAKQAGDNTSMILIVGWAAVSYILWGMAYTVGDIPLWGIISRMSENEKDRSVLISLSRIIASIGAAAVVVSICPISQAVNKAMNLSETDQKGFIIIGFAMTIVASLLFECAGIGTRERVPASEEKKTMKESFALMWKCKPFRRLLISGILRAPNQLLMLVAMPLLSYYYCDGDLTKAFTDVHNLLVIIMIGGGLFVGQFLTMAICPALIKKYDVKKIYNLFSGLSAIPYVLIFVVYLLAPTRLHEFGWAAFDGLLLFGAGAGFGAVNVCQSVMISDCIDYEEYHSGYRPDGVFFSGQSFITKFSAGVASIISAFVYNKVGYTDVNIAAMNEAIKDGASFAVDYPDFSKAMWFLISVPVAVGMVISVIPTIKYEITKESHDKMLSELVERHKTEE
ncbi:MAG: MFS transporter [Clostridium sp.]|nr:MFS transporter [Clostridium sp.]